MCLIRVLGDVLRDCVSRGLCLGSLEISSAACLQSKKTNTKRLLKMWRQTHRNVTIKEKNMLQDNDQANLEKKITPRTVKIGPGRRTATLAISGISGS